MSIFRFDPPDYSTSQQQYGLSGLGIGGVKETKTTYSSQQKFSKHSAFGNPVSSSPSTSSWERQNESKTGSNSGYGYSKKRLVVLVSLLLLSFIKFYSSQGSNSSSSSSDTAQTRFGGAKSISSDQYFNRDRVEVSLSNADAVCLHMVLSHFYFTG